MKKETFDALVGSIKKWYGIAYYNRYNGGRLDCPLCNLYFYEEDVLEVGCEGCPVKDVTGLQGCNDTPYQQYVHLLTNKHAHARKEFYFLLSLLPMTATVTMEDGTKWSAKSLTVED